MKNTKKKKNKTVKFTHTCFRGAFPPVDLRAVCFVRAIKNLNFQ